MATNAELYGVIQRKGDVVGRVIVGLVKKAWLVLAEADTVANHANRLALVQNIIRSPESLAGPMTSDYVKTATFELN